MVLAHGHPYSFAQEKGASHGCGAGHHRSAFRESSPASHARIWGLSNSVDFTNAMLQSVG